MKSTVRFAIAAMLMGMSVVLLFSFVYSPPLPVKNYRFPYKQAGLTERQAAAQLLSRFTYGATPGQIDAVAKMGLENWFQQQLDGGLPDDSLNQRLSIYPDLKLSNAQVADLYPHPAILQQMALRDGVINKDSVNKANNKMIYLAYMQKKGLKIEQVLYQQFINQKILRATYTNNQLQEVLTEFWFNHFNVSITKEDCAQFIPDYERDVIRPNALGKFDALLLATAKSPAMLYYLDNFSSAAANTNTNAADAMGMKMIAEQMTIKGDTNYQQNKIMNQLQQNRKTQGLNENYAREVMELHTLGVDGGYTQSDVTQAAKVLTGWTVYPMNDLGYGNAIRKVIDRIGEGNLIKAGFVHDGDFFFAMNRHDKGEKTVLGKHFAAFGGYQEGVDLLEMLAHEQATAKFVCKKIAVRFVSDDAPQTLVDKMAKTFSDQDGDIKQVLITMVTAPEFWSAQSVRQKTKSPFELAISSLRAINADVRQPAQVNQWITKMGQKIYYYQAPTGFPDKGQYWINTGALLNRMNFGLALAAHRIPGVSFNIAALNQQHEPESAQAALITYGKLMMPERNLDETVKRLTPMLTDPNLAKKVDEAAGKATPVQQVNMPSNSYAMGDTNMNENRLNNKNQNMNNDNTMLAQVLGILIGSPEYQRR